MSLGEPPVGLPHRPIANAGNPVLPAGTWDCHFHIIAPGAPMVTPRSYTPPSAMLQDWQAMARRVGIERGVIVQPSIYGQDNSVLLAALQSAPDQLRGIVVIPPRTPEVELERMDRFGVRGVRINLRNLGGLPLDAVPRLAAEISPLGWHLQFQIGPDQIDDLDSLLRGLPVDAVIDHCAFIQVSDPDKRAMGLLALQTFLDRPGRYVKLSAPYRLANPFDRHGFAELAHGLAHSHPDCLLWATDWPHTEVFEHMPDDVELANDALVWFPHVHVREKVLVGTPAMLYR